MQDLTVIENELVPVYETSTGEKVVYGSELHQVLNVKSPYREWSSRRFKDCDAEENADFYSVEISTLVGGSPKKDHIVKLDTAKEMAMLERNVQGKTVRRYFIAVEEKYKKQITQPKPKRKRLKPKDLSVKQHMNIAEIMIEKVGLDPGIAYSVAIDEAEKESGCNLLAYEKLLPAADHPTGMYNATDLGKRVRPDSPVSPRAINKTLKALGLQVREKDWVITEAGKEYGEMMPYTASFNNGSSHSNYRPLWNEKAVELLKEYYKEEGDK